MMTTTTTAGTSTATTPVGDIVTLMRSMRELRLHPQFGSTDFAQQAFEEGCQALTVKLSALAGEDVLAHNPVLLAGLTGLGARGLEILGGVLLTHTYAVDASQPNEDAARAIYNWEVLLGILARRNGRPGRALPAGLRELPTQRAVHARGHLHAIA